VFPNLASIELVGLLNQLSGIESEPDFKCASPGMVDAQSVHSSPRGPLPRRHQIEWSSAQLSVSADCCYVTPLHHFQRGDTKVEVVHCHDRGALWRVRCDPVFDIAGLRHQFPIAIGWDNAASLFVAFRRSARSGEGFARAWPPADRDEA
jgi:hypothetical protein